MTLDGSGNLTVPGSANVGGPAYTSSQLNVGGANAALRVTGTGSYGSVGRINLGDGDYVHISEPTDDSMELKSSNFNVNSSGLQLSTPSGTSVAMEVAGRIRSGNGTYGQGGMWVGYDSGNSVAQFVGSQNIDYMGLYNNGWNVTTNRWGNTTTAGALTTGGGIISQAGLFTTTNIYALGSSWVNASRFVGRCQWAASGYSNDGYGTSGCTGDVAEAYETTEKTGAGDILMFDNGSAMKMKLASKNASGKLAGVVSTSAGVILTDKGPVIGDGKNENYLTDTKTLLALSGKVPVKINEENGPIKIGDYVTASSTPGVGMKANTGDQVIGIAMENSSAAKDGKIYVLTDKSGSVSDLKAELDKKINSLEERLSKLEKQLATK